MSDYPIFVSGEFVQTSEVLEVRNPYSQQVFATTYVAGKTEI